MTESNRVVVVEVEVEKKLHCTDKYDDTSYDGQQVLRRGQYGLVPTGRYTSYLGRAVVGIRHLQRGSVFNYIML
ncbi:hypothetical protein KXD40_008004 [Peronospora effusa]|nr:hypothetical protein KXD40_008004 [Peronospora effusa]